MAKTLPIDGPNINEPLSLHASGLPALDLQSLHQPQDANHGLPAVFGRWPGDESDEEVFRALEELS